MADYTEHRLYQTGNTGGHPKLQQMPQLSWELCGTAVGQWFNWICCSSFLSRKQKNSKHMQCKIEFLTASQTSVFAYRYIFLSYVSVQSQY